jgi:hypothetical protein
VVLHSLHLPFAKEGSRGLASGLSHFERNLSQYENTCSQRLEGPVGRWNSDCPRCDQLEVGMVLTQLDDQSLKEMSRFKMAQNLPLYEHCDKAVNEQSRQSPVDECSENTDKKGSHHAKASRSHPFQARCHNRHGHAYRRINADDNPWTGPCREPDGPGDSGCHANSTTIIHRGLWLPDV